MSAPAREFVGFRSQDPQRPTFLSLFESEFAYVCRSLRRFGVSAEDVRDAAQDVFIAVNRHYASYDPTRPVRPWLFAFAVRVAAKYKDKARRYTACHDEDTLVELLDETPGADEQLAAFRIRRLVLKVLATLDPDRRAVIILHDLDEQPMPEVAFALGIPLNTAYSRLRLARADFRAAIFRSRSTAGGETFGRHSLHAFR